MDKRAFMQDQHAFEAYESAIADGVYLDEYNDEGCGHTLGYSSSSSISNITDISGRDLQRTVCAACVESRAETGDVKACCDCEFYKLLKEAKEREELSICRNCPKHPDNAARSEDLCYEPVDDFGWVNTDTNNICPEPLKQPYMEPVVLYRTPLKILMLKREDSTDYPVIKAAFEVLHHNTVFFVELQNGKLHDLYGRKLGVTITRTFYNPETYQASYRKELYIIKSDGKWERCGNSDSAYRLHIPRNLHGVPVGHSMKDMLGNGLLEETCNHVPHQKYNPVYKEYTTVYEDVYQPIFIGANELFLITERIADNMDRGFRSRKRMVSTNGIDNNCSQCVNCYRIPVEQSGDFIPDGARAESYLRALSIGDKNTDGQYQCRYYCMAHDEYVDIYPTAFRNAGSRVQGGEYHLSGNSDTASRPDQDTIVLGKKLSSMLANTGFVARCPWYYMKRFASVNFKDPWIKVAFCKIDDIGDLKIAFPEKEIKYKEIPTFAPFLTGDILRELQENPERAQAVREILAALKKRGMKVTAANIATLKTRIRDYTYTYVKDWDVVVFDHIQVYR